MKNPEVMLIVGGGGSFYLLHYDALRTKIDI